MARATEIAFPRSGALGTVTPALRPQAGSRAIDRLVVLDAARVLAALGVVWFHTIESADLRASGVLGRFSVAFYSMVGVLFLFEHLERNPDRGFLTYAWGRIQRLYLPFLAWTAVSIGLFAAARATAFPDLHMPALDWNLLVGGATIPLWFIPFMVVAMMLVFPVAKFATRRRDFDLAVLGLALATALTLDYLPTVLDSVTETDVTLWDSPPLQDVPVLGRFLALSWNRWSAVFWGMALAITYRRWIRDSAWRWLIGIAGGVGTVLLVSTMWVLASRDGTPPNPALKVLTGLSFALMTLAPWRGPLIAWLGRYGYLSFGLYFVHMTVIVLVRAVVDRFHDDRCWARDVLVFGASVLLSVLLLRTLERFRVLKWMIG